jgi:azurin
VAPVEEHPLRHLLADAPSQWPQQIETAIEWGRTSPYAVDTIGLPFENPWNALLFCGGHDFLPDGSALICTMQGDVWHVSGFEHPSKTATWRRFAAGLHHALGLVIDDDGIFVLGRDQITRLHDRNGDGEADFYECFSRAYETSPAGHDFICGLERDHKGRFYTASGNQGLLQISADGRRAEVLATGFRNPDGLGLLPDGTLTVPSSEGEWTPASMICAVRPRQQVPHFGYLGPKEGRVPDLPLVYLPRGLDNSSGGQTTVDSERWGPLSGQLLHFSFGAGSHCLILRDEVEGQLQGAAVPLPGEFRSGAHRGRFHPRDGQLYVTGMQGWGCYTPDDGCFQRVRYTGEPVQLPTAFHAFANGVSIEFSAPLDASTAAQARNHFAQCWNYRYGPGYGSPEFSAAHAGLRGHDPLAIASAHVLSDGRRLFLEIPELQPVNQLHLRVQSSPAVFCDLFLTVHKLDAPFTGFDGYKPAHKSIRPHPILADLAMAARMVPNPHRKRIENARPITIETGSHLSYATRSISVRAGEPLALTLSNPDVVPHNWALVAPGTLERVGELADRLISDPDAALYHYIPRTSDVLAYIDVVGPRDKFTIYFHAPQQPGRYQYFCTFPGHWKVMNGEMVVTPAMP